MVRKFYLAVAAALSVLGVATGEDPARDDGAPVAIVLGAPVTRAELQAQREDPGSGPLTDADLGGALCGLVVTRLSAQYVDTHNLHATDQDIAGFSAVFAGTKEEMRRGWQKKVLETREKLNDPTTPEADRKNLEKELAHFERQANGELWPDADERKELADSLPGLQQKLDAGGLLLADAQSVRAQIEYATRFAGLSDEQAKWAWAALEEEQNRKVAAPFIEWWKFNRALFKQYGGRILFQQAGLEAFDATKTWLEEREKAGDFSIVDETLKPGFWSYYTGQTTMLIEKPEGTEFDQPWWNRAVPGE